MRPPTEISENIKRSIKDLYLENKDDSFISKKLGISTYLVRKVAKELGIYVRLRGLYTAEHHERSRNTMNKTWKEGKLKGGGHVGAMSEEKRQKLRDQKGDKSPTWKGGKFRQSGGYIWIYSPDHPIAKTRKNKYYLEHRLVMEKHLGRILERNEHVHHINQKKDDNRIENLIVVSHKNHYGEIVCPHCQKTFLIQ